MSTDHNPNVSFASDPITHRHNRRGRHGRVAAVPPRSILESILEPLEARLLMSTYWVTSAADSGAGSLRAAILAADAAGGSNVIDFAIGSGLQDISLQTALPAVTDSLTIDGTTQSGYAGTPLISLNGQGLTTAANGLTVTGNNTLIRGLDIVGFTADGILLQGSGETVQNSFVGVEADGVTATANGANGIEVSGPAGGARQRRHREQRHLRQRRQRRFILVQLHLQRGCGQPRRRGRLRQSGRGQRGRRGSTSARQRRHRAA